MGAVIIYKGGVGVLYLKNVHVRVLGLDIDFEMAARDLPLTNQLLDLMPLCLQTKTCAQDLTAVVTHTI